MSKKTLLAKRNFQKKIKCLIFNIKKFWVKFFFKIQDFMLMLLLLER